jgi:hypothetical protein
VEGTKGLIGHSKEKLEEIQAELEENNATGANDYKLAQIKLLLE